MQNHAEKAPVVKPRTGRVAITVCELLYLFRFLPWHRRRNMRKEEQSNMVKREVKGRLFRFLFEKDRENLLQLYNALNGTDYRDAGALQVVTIKNAVYVTMKNDLAFVLMGTLNMYEHQSTYSSNMPVRFLIYLAEEYQKIVEKAESSLYGTKLISLPTPQCVVFYNGEKERPPLWIFRDNTYQKEKTGMKR